MTVSEVAVDGEGTLLLPGRLLGDVVRNLPDGEVSLALRAEERDVELTAGSARFHLRTLPVEDFPRLPELEGEAAKAARRAAGGDHRPGGPGRVAG